MAVDWPGIADEVRQMLHGLDEVRVDVARIQRFAEGIASGELGPQINQLDTIPEPAGLDTVQDAEAFSAAERERFIARGRAALEAGQVASVVLNGGMATRFGGVVKGVVEALGGRSFLELKLADVRRYGEVPFLTMNSFATHHPTLRFIEEKGLANDVMPFLQAASVRLTPEGLPFRQDDNRLSLYAPGHGDFCEVLASSGRLQQLRERGVVALMLSNVDNLGAELDPLIVGYHLEHGKALTVEVAKTRKGDIGGAPARVDGKLQVVEGFRFPKDFNFDSVPFMNTNTFMISLEALESSPSLTWFYVEKTVEGRKAVQMERLVGELSACAATAYLATPRDGPGGRFLPVKTPSDLDAMRADPVLIERFSDR